MSKSITRFERRHGVQLLHRTTHSLSLTDEGEQLLEGARHLMQEVQRLEMSMGDGAVSALRGRVKISAPGSFARVCLVPFLSVMRTRFPEIDIDLSFEDTLVDLAAEGVDIALRSGILEGQPGHVAKELIRYPYVLCATPGYLAKRGIPNTPADLVAHEHISFRNHGTGQILTWQFADPKAQGNTARFAPNGGIVVDDGGAGWQLMREGLGITWGPDWLGLDDLRSGRVVEVMKDWRVPKVPLSAVRLGRRHAPQRTRALLTFLTEIAPNWQFG